MRQTRRWTPLGVSVLTFLSISPGAFADVTVERTTTTERILPGSTVMTIKRTVNPDFETTRLWLFPVKPASSSSSVTTVKEGPYLGIENFSRRLSLMKEQLDNGILRGWISPGEAAALNDRYAHLKAQVDFATRNGLTYEMGNSLERGLNQFNIDLSDQMSTASAGIIQ